MAAKPEARRTTDPDEIRRWAEARDGRPATDPSTCELGDDIGVLRIMFRDDPALRAIEWDDFFDKLEEDGLEFVYQERTADGKLSRFYRMVER